MSGCRSLNKLKDGATFGIFAPASPCCPKKLKAGLKELKRLGFDYKMPLDPSANYGNQENGLFSASLEDRLKVFNDLISDPEVDLLLASRGGYGSLGMLPGLDFRLISEARKPIVGYSDVTVLLATISAQSQIPAIHGATLANEFAESSSNTQKRESVALLIDLLKRKTDTVAHKINVLRSGSAEGTLLAGNLTMLCSLLGTPWDPSYKGEILVLEEVGEAPYRVHRLLTQLKLAGKFDDLAGVVFGRFSRCKSPHGIQIQQLLEASVKDIFCHTSYPIFFGLEFGHDEKNIPLPLGCKARIENDTLCLIESPVA